MTPDEISDGLASRGFLEGIGDVRSSSTDARYAGVVFTGTMSEALAQARAMPEYPLPNVQAAKRAGVVSLARYELLHFLRLV